MQVSNAQRRSRGARRSAMALSAAIGAAALFAATSASAAPLTWDNNGATAPNPQDGLGTWDLVALNWFNGASNVAWINANNDTAVFGAGGVGDVVTLAGGTNIGGLRFDVAGYTLTGGGLTVSGPTTIALSAAGQASLSTAVGGTGDVTFNIAAGGTLNADAGHNYAGNTTVTGGGILNIATIGVVSGSITLDNGGLRFRDTRVIANPIFVPTGSTGTIALIGNGTLNGAISGGGTLVHDGTGTNKILSPNTDNSGFTGTWVVANGGTLRFTNANAGSANARFQLNGGSISNRASSVTIHLGELTGTAGSALQGSISLDGLVTYAVGGLNTDAQFDGNITNGTSAARRAALQKVGTGRWTITGANTYTGNTSVDNGTLALGAAATLATTPFLAVHSPGNLDVSAVSNFAVASGQTLHGNGGTIHGNVAVVAGASVNAGSITTADTLNFANDLSLSGGELRFDVGSGNDRIGVGGALNLASGSVYVNPIGGGFSVGNVNLGTYGGALGGAVSNVSLLFGQRATGTLTASGGQLNLNIASVGGTGTLTWTGAVSGDWAVSGAQNFFNADPAVNGPDSFFQNDHVIFGTPSGAGTTTINKIGLIQPQSLTMNAASGSYTIGGAGTLTGTFGLEKSGDSTLVLATPNTFTGVTNINGGTLLLNNAAGAGTAAVNVNSGALMLGGVTYGNAVNINSPSAIVGGGGTFTGSFTDFGTPWNISVPAGQTTSLGAGVFASGLATGNISLGTSNGGLRFTGTGAASVINASSNTIDLGTGSATMLSRDGNGGTITIGAVAGGPNTTMRGASNTNAVVTYVLGGNGASTTMAGTIANGSQAASPALNLIKNGGGTFTVGGNNTYTGTTVVNGGALIVNGTHTGAGTYTIASGATFGGKGTITGQVNVASGVTIVPGAAVGTLTVGGLAINADTINYEFDANGGDAIVVSNAGGLAVIGNTQINIADLGGVIAGAYPLVDYNGTPIATGFTLNQATLAGFTATLVYNNLDTSVDLLLTGGAGPVTALWNNTGGGDWPTGANWLGGVPNAVGSRANFNGAITAPSTVNVTAPQTVSQINFSNTNSYTVAGSGITLDVASGPAAIGVFVGSHTISAPLSLADNTNVSVTGANSLTLSNLQTTTSGISKSGAGVLVVNRVSAASLDVTGGSVRVVPNGTASGASKVASLNLAAGTSLDVTNNAFVVDYDSTDPSATIRALLTSGYAAGSWNGVGINSSTAAATANHGVGHARSADVLAAPIFGTVDATAVLIRYTRLGDANLDGIVDIGDFSLLGANFNISASEWSKGDFNYDNITDIGDFAQLAANFNQTIGADLPRGAAVPEPTAAIMLLGAGLGIRRRR